MANKVDVFTEELSKVFTILQQQYVMIKYMKALITSGELDETEINKLKEQVTKMNNKLNSIIDDELVAIKQNIMHIENNITEIEKVMPTDINADIDGNLILEHDGIEITAQKKQVAVYTKAQVNALISEAGLKTFELNYPYTGMYPTDNHAVRTITNETQIPIVYKCIHYVKEHGACILKIRNGMITSTGYTDYNPVYVLCITSPDSDNSIIECYGTTGEYIIKLISDNDTSLGSESNTKIIYDKIAKASDIKNVYRHQLTLTNTNDVSVNCNIYSSNNLKIDSVQDFVTVVKSSVDYAEQAIYLDNATVKPAYIRYSAGNVIIQLSGGGLSPVKTITDIVTTI